MSDVDDADLVERAQNGDASAAGELYNRHREGIFKYAWVSVRDSHLADDLTSDIFMRMIAALPDYRPTKVPFAAWLFRIARNRILDHHRRNKSHMSVPIHHFEQATTRAENPSAIVESQLTIEGLKEALEAIDENQREVLRLRFLVGLPLRDVARIVDKTEAATKSLQHRGLIALRVALNFE